MQLMHVYGGSANSGSLYSTVVMFLRNVPCLRVFSGKDTARVWSGSEGLTAPFGPFRILSRTSARLNHCTCGSFWRLSSKPVLVYPGLNLCADVA
jgi:hypothetical protein